MRRLLPVLGVVLALAVLAAPAGAARTSLLRAGAGQADITPPKTGYFLGGWTRADRLALGQSTRTVPTGTYRLHVIATRCGLTTQPFAVTGG